MSESRRPANRVRSKRASGSSPTRLPREFYVRPTLEVAPEVLGKYLVYDSPLGRLSARIVEVEAYIGQDDPACHASAGLTPRTRPMFGPGGFTYIYFVYGMYYCLNLVTEPKGQAAAILVRAAEPDEGQSLMSELSKGMRGSELLNGPGKLCRSFGLTTAQNELDLTEGTIYLEDRNIVIRNIGQSQRVGIKSGKDRMWRFYDADSDAVSRTK